MIGVQRPPVEPDDGAKAASLDHPLRRIVTSLAQALKRPEPEFVDVAVMRFDVITDFCRRDDAALQAIRTKRVFEQLALPDPGPTSRRVPLVPFSRLAAEAHGSSHQAPITGLPVARRLGSSGATSAYHCFDLPLCERNALLTAEDLQQHRDPFVRGHAGIDCQMPFERTGQYSYALTTL
jgi:hypothetical protein